MEYEVYRHNNASEEEFQRINQIFKVVLSEDKDLCNAAQKNLEAGVFTHGELHPTAEKVSDQYDDDVESFHHTAYKMLCRDLCTFNRRLAGWSQHTARPKTPAKRQFGRRRRGAEFPTRAKKTSHSVLL